MVTEPSHFALILASCVALFPSNLTLVLRARVLEVPGMVGAGFRWLVWQSKSIDESGADLAHDERRLLEPPVKAATDVLWAGPPEVQAGAGIALAIARRRATAVPCRDAA